MAACRQSVRSLYSARTMSAPSVFDCFCGLGGLSLGAELAGYNVVGGVDANPHAIATFRQTFPNKLALEHDLLAESPKAILRSAGIRRGDIDVLMGGPPCQPYSVNNHQRGTADHRCGLVESYLEFVGALKPKWLVMENVPGFASIENGRFLGGLLSSLQDRGYEGAHVIINACSFGVPQRRRRLVVLASRKKSAAPNLIESLRGVSTAQPITVGEAIGDLPMNADGDVTYSTRATGLYQRSMRKSHRRKVDFHSAHQLGTLNLQRIKHVPPGGNWRNIPYDLLPPGMQRARPSDHTTRYGRLRSDRPAFTLLTKCDPHWGCFIHPSEDRVLTVREAARLQSIPDRVTFSAPLIEAYRLVGNAVPPFLAKGILELISNQ